MNFLDLIFPKMCLNCGKSGDYICRACLEKVKTVKPICPECQKPSVDGRVHFRCIKPQGMDGLISIWDYDGVIRKAILSLKYKFALDISRELSLLFLEFLKLHTTYYILPATGVLVSIPTARLRENWRGFNQAEEIGKQVAEGLGLQFNSELLIRKKSAVPQTELKGKERVSNIQGVFSVSPNILVSEYPSIFLFDDVWTTGSTLKEAAKVLKRKGVKSVWGLTIAR